ncbi:MAG: rRNA (adenine2030-N6)-methyltransferase [Alphaproteobacteria bacterium]|nr:rRNA (adenine2030-N6)-methyltransferase [Alphaproteobacteria bacterium]
MNYRHEFHAGNFADVVKHVTLSRIVAHLRAKPGAFRVIDTHAGTGLYDLTGPQASRTNEWRDGIARLLAADLAAEVRELLAPYLDAVAAYNPPGALTRYPGSPMLVRAWLRPADRLIACELEPAAAAALAANLTGRRAKALTMDGWTAASAYVPPKERRGLVLIDPPFEAADDFTRLAAALSEAWRKWATGIYLLWYPIKDRSGPDGLAKRLAKLRIGKILRAEVLVTRPTDPSRLNGCGLIIVNPPWKLEAELAVLLPALVACLQQGSGSFRLEWLARES